VSSANEELSAELARPQESTGQAEVRVGRQGRVVIPAHLREALDLAAGEVLVARKEGGRLILERREAVLRRLQGAFAVLSNEKVSLADEVIEDRRKEAWEESQW